MLTTPVTIINKLGLHARAAAKFVAVASRFRCDIQVRRGNKVVNGKSIMGVMMLAASRGTQLELITIGDDERDAANDLVNLINNRFDESE